MDFYLIVYSDYEGNDILFPSDNFIDISLKYKSIIDFIKLNKERRKLVLGDITEDELEDCDFDPWDEMFHRKEISNEEWKTKFKHIEYYDVWIWEGNKWNSILDIVKREIKFDNLDEKNTI